MITSGVSWQRHFMLELPQTCFAVWGATLLILFNALLARN